MKETRLIRHIRWILRTGTVLGSLTLAAAAAQARPEYAAKEMKVCGYCHVNPAGAGARNPRGVYYAAHDHSFTGFDEAKVMGPPSFKQAWKVDVPAGARRIAVSDVTSDKKPRLLVLGEDNSLTIDRLTNTDLEKEDSLDLGAGAAKFVAGHFVKGKPAVIAVPGALYYRDGDKYSKKEAPDLKDITGLARFAGGVENLFTFNGTDPETWAVDPSADKPLTPGKKLVPPDKASGVLWSAVLHAAPEALAAIGVPEIATKAGVVGGLDPREDGRYYAFAPLVGPDGSFLVIANLGESGLPTPVWRSPKLTGKVLDVAVGSDPKGSHQTGFFILEASGVDGKARLVEFYALE